MRHRKRGRKLGRNPAHRKALLRNMANSLFLYGRIITTVPKAKELRPFAERLITIARRGTLHARRLVISRLGKQPIPERHPDHGRYRNVVHKLFDEIAPRYIDRPGGYTRIVRLAKRRIGDAAELAVIELVQESIAESRERNRARRRRRPEKPTAAEEARQQAPEASAEAVEAEQTPSESAEPAAVTSEQGGEEEPAEEGGGAEREKEDEEKS